MDSITSFFVSFCEILSNNKIDLKIFEGIDVGLLSDPSTDFAINFLFLKVDFVLKNLKF